MSNIQNKVENSKVLSPKKKHLNKQEALLAYLKEHYEFRYNIIRNRYEVKAVGEDQWKEINENALWSDVNKLHGKTSKDYLLNTIGSSCISSRCNPLLEWLESLPAPNPDALSPIGLLASKINLSVGGDDSRGFDRLMIVLRKWFVGAIKTLLDNRYIHKQAIVFQGKPGIGKTPFAASLLPSGMHEYLKFTSYLDVRSKDTTLSLTSSWIIILDEIDYFMKTKQNSDNYKAFMTQKWVNERPPYAKVPVSIQRVCVFFGTCNESTFLNDPTGTQRFSVFSIESFAPDIKEFMKEHIVDCWAEAYHLYKNGFNPEYTKEELADNEEKNEEYKYNSPEFETILQYLAPAKKGEDNAVFLTTTSICSQMNAKQTDIIFNNNSLGRAFVRLDLVRKKETVGNQRIYGYWIKWIK